MRLVVVGGGPTGLTAALLAAEEGHDVTLLERGDRFGGMSASISVAGQRVDLGSHRLHPTASESVRTLLERLLGDDLQTRHRNGRIRLGGRWVAFPLSALNLARHLPPRFVAMATFDSLSAPFRRERANTYHEVIRAGLGPAVLKWFYGPYASKLWGVPATALHGDIARRRVAVSSAAKLLGKLLRAATGGPPTFLYPRNGYGQIVDRLVAECEGAGVSMHLGCSVTEIQCVAEIHSGEVAPVTLSYETAEEKTTTTCDRVFWTAAPHHLLDVVRETGSAPQFRPRHRAVVLVYLTLATDRYTPYDAHYFPELELLPARVSEPKNYRDADDPSGRTVLCAEIVCDPGDDVWSASPEHLTKLTTEALASADLPALDVVGVHIERLPAVYPVVGPNDMEQMQLVLQRAHNVPNATVLGRQGLLVADNLHHVLDMAMTAVDCLGSDGGWNETEWLRALDRFERNVVED